MQIEQLWRYPVKSMQGESLSAADVDEFGIVGDRQWAIFDVGTGLGLTARREPKLLFASAALVTEPSGSSVLVTLPDGRVSTGDADLSDWLGRPVTLRRCGAGPGTFEIATDFEAEDTSPWVQWNGSVDTFHDSTRDRMSIASSASMRQWDVRRFRINVIVSAELPDDVVGRRLHCNDVEFECTKPIDRCVMITRPQPGGIERDLGVLRTIIAEMDNKLGVATVVHRTGRLQVGDAISIS